jgi:hypothetical protein
VSDRDQSNVTAAALAASCKSALPHAAAGAGHEDNIARVRATGALEPSMIDTTSVHRDD